MSVTIITVSDSFTSRAFAEVRIDWNRLMQFARRVSTRAGMFIRVRFAELRTKNRKVQESSDNASVDGLRMVGCSVQTDGPDNQETTRSCGPTPSRTRRESRTGGTYTRGLSLSRRSWFPRF